MLELKDIINKLKQDISSFNLYFCSKLKDGKYVSFSPNVNNKIHYDLINPTIKCLDKYINHNIVSYSPIGYEDNTIEMYDINSIKNYKNIEQSFNNADNVETAISLDNCDFYVLELKYKNRSEEFNVRIFRKLTKFKKLCSKGFIANFNGKTLNKIESKIVGIDGEVDLLVVGEEVIVLSHYSLERIFNLETQFKDTASDFLNNNFLSDIIYNFEINIKYNENPFYLIYENKRQIKDILRILRDSYYVSTINSNPDIDSKLVDTGGNKKSK